ncbi:MAG: acyloxyacyl hydrolase [Desulfohalobiaceae bacterium]|nr:acyloxyacyl hydrolase [Desulfohalobiaceae bacterium]
MRTAYLLLSCLFLLVFLPFANCHAFDAYSLSLGKSTHGAMTSVNLGVRKILMPELFQTTTGTGSLSLEGAVGWWNDKGDNFANVSLVPLAIYTFDKVFSGWRPYVEIGVGPGLVSDTVVEDRELGSNLLFMDKFGAGVIFGDDSQYRLGIRYHHMSNADLASQNDGIDLGLLLLEYSLE